MSFTIVRTNGTVLTVIPDGDLNTTSTPLFLPGRNYPGYGAVIDTNFVRALENFAFTNPPDNPLQGQLWYNTRPGFEGLYVCPIDGETNPSNWIKLSTANDPTASLLANNLTLTGDLGTSNAYVSDNITATSIDTDYLTVNIQANIANANVTGNTVVANLQTANITTGSNTTSGNLTGAWTLNGNLTSNGNITSLGFVSGNYRYANGQLINFDQAAGSNGQVQYNLNGNLSSSSKLIFSDSGALLTVDGSIKAINFETTGGVFTGNAAGLYNVPSANLNGTLPTTIQSNITQLGALSALTVTNTINTANVFVSNTVSAARLTGTLTTAAQPNITSVGTLSTLSVSGFINAGTVSGILIGDGGNISNIQGATVVGEVSSAAVANLVSVSNVVGIGNIAVLNRDGNSSNILYGNGVFAAAPEIPQNTYGDGNVVLLLSSYGSNSISTSGNVTAGNMSATGITGNTLTGSLTTAAQPNITSVGVLTGLTVNGNINSSNVSGNHIGDGSRLTNINGSNVTNKVANAVYADSAGSANSADFATNASNANYANSAGNANLANSASTAGFATLAGGLTGNAIIGIPNGGTGAGTAERAGSNLGAIGVGQTWQNLTTSRTIGATYTNTTGRPIMVYVRANWSYQFNARLIATVGGIEVASFGAHTDSATVNFLVPAGTAYQVTVVGTSATIGYWAELRN